MAHKRQYVAWECSHCGHRHMWLWSQDDMQEACEIRMGCDKCDRGTWCEMRRLGRNIWAAVWQ